MARHRCSGLLLAALIAGCAPDPVNAPDRVFGAAALGNLSVGSDLKSDCAACVFGPRTYTRMYGEPVTQVSEFPGDPAADYIIDIDNADRRGAESRVVLNGETVFPDLKREEERSSRRHVRRSVRLRDTNRLETRLTGKPGSTLRVYIVGGARVIDAAGGSLTASGGATLDVPAGALSAATELSLYLNPAAVPSQLIGRAVSPAIELGPDGIQFLRPVTLTIDLPPNRAVGSRPQLFRLIPNSTLLEHQVGSEFVPVTGQLRASLSHFTTYIAIWETYAARTTPYSYRLFNHPSKVGGGTTSSDVDADVDRAIGLWLGYTRKIGIDFGRLSVSCPNVEVRWESLGATKGGTDARPIDIEYGLLCSGRLQRVVYLNDDLIWRATDRGPAVGGEWNIADVMSHEFGHVLGLDHPSGPMCRDYLENQILPPGGNVSICLQPPTMRAKGENAVVPVLLQYEDLDNLQQVYGATGWRDASAQRVEIVAGDGQGSVPANGLVPVAPQVRVVDQTGTGVQGAIVVFTPLAGSTAQGVAATTNSAGIATVAAWRLGGAPGAYRLTAAINLGTWPNVPRVTFTATVSAIQMLASGLGYVFALSRSGTALSMTDYSGGGLYKVGTGGGALTPLATGLTNNGPAGVVNDGTNVYWIEVNAASSTGGGSIRRIPAGGGAISTRAAFSSIGAPLSADGGALYFWADGFIKRLQKAGGTAINLVQANTADGPAFTVSGGLLYFLDAGQIKRVSTGGGPATTMTSGVTNASDLLAVGTTLFWTNPYTNSCCIQGIFSVPTSAVSAAPISRALVNSMNNLATDGTSLYARGLPGVFRYPLSDFSHPTTLATFGGNGAGFALAVDGQSVYWAHFGQVFKTAK